MSLEDDFQLAIARVNALPRAPSPKEMLELYGHYKQATAGDASGARPGMLDVRARAKFDAWAAQRGTPRETAMQSYIDLGRRLGA